MAKIIKVGSQNPTFTSQKVKKASPLHTHRNSNEATNPFKFTNFEGNTLQFADVFEGFKPNLKATPANKLRMVATSVAGSMNKVKSIIPESIINFVRKVRSDFSIAWDYAKNTNVSDAMSDAAHAIKENHIIKRTSEVLNTPIPMPSLGLSEKLDNVKRVLNTPINLPSLNITERILAHREAAHHNVLDLGKGISEKWNGMIANISFHGKQKYANMSVAELETRLAAALAEGGINE